MKQLRFESFPAHIKCVARPTAEPTEHGHACPECGDVWRCYLACPQDTPEKACAECVLDILEQWEDGELSEGEAAKALGVPRVIARQMRLDAEMVHRST